MLKRFYYAQFFEVARIVIYAAFWSLFETKWRFKCILRRQNASSRFFKDSLNLSFASSIDFMSPYAQKVHYAPYSKIGITWLRSIRVEVSLRCAHSKDDTMALPLLPLLPPLLPPLLLQAVDFPGPLVTAVAGACVLIKPRLKYTQSFSNIKVNPFRSESSLPKRTVGLVSFCFFGDNHEKIQQWACREDRI